MSETEADFSAGRDKSKITGAQQTIFSEALEMVMVMARIVVKERIGGGISHDEIGGADVSRLGVEGKEAANSGHCAAFVNGAIIGTEGAINDVGRAGGSINHQVRQSAGRVRISKAPEKAKK